MRAIQVYAPETQRAEYEKAAQLAAGWLVKAEPKSNEDRAFQLLGLKWSKASKEIIRKAAGELLAAQRADDGWGQLPSMASDAYATGLSMFALNETGRPSGADAAIQRATKFLVSTQRADGSWHVRSRAPKFQPYFDGGFPYGHDEWISMWATGYATAALSHTLPEIRAAK